MQQDFASGILLVIGLASLILMFYAAIFAIPLAAAGFGGYIVYQLVHHSPAAKERKAKAHTLQLYEAARSVTPQIPAKHEFGVEVYSTWPELPEDVDQALTEAVLDLYDIEFGDAYDIPPPPPICNSLEGARYRDFLSSYSSKVHHKSVAKVAASTIAESIRRFCTYLPSLPDDEEAIAYVSVSTFIPNLGEAVEDVLRTYYSEDAKNVGLFEGLCEQLNINLHEVSGIPYTFENRSHPKLVLPTEYEGQNVQYAYLKDTPLLKLFDVHIPFAIPRDTFFEHLWLLAPPGTGKTQTIQHFVLHHLKRVANDECSVIVMDSQSDLINMVRSLNVFAPGQELEDKLIVIKPSLAHPPALNLFDIGRERINAYSDDDREKFTNIAINQLTYVLEALMGEGAAMTPKQSTLYRYCIRLMMNLEDSTITDFAQLLKVTNHKGMATYQPVIDKLHAPAREFFASQFIGGEFEETKKQLAWRIANLQENEYFNRMFSHPRSKIDLFTELNSSKVILIDTDKEHLDADGTNIFGRFFIAALLTASQERASIERGSRQDVFCMIDEAQDYIRNDRKIADLFDQARKMRISMLVANQRTKQITNSNVLDALASVSTMFASTENPKDASFLAAAMQTTPEFIARQPERHFAAYVRRTTKQGAISLRIPFFEMENMEKMPKEVAEQVQHTMHLQYCSTTPQASPTSPEPDVDDVIYVLPDVDQAEYDDPDDPDITPKEEV